MKNDNYLIVTEGYLSLWQKLIAAVCFTTSFGFFAKLLLEDLYNANVLEIIKCSFCVYLSLHIGIMFAIVIEFKFDIKQKRYRRQYRVGPFRIGLWKKLPLIEYVSVFKQNYFNTEIESNRSSRYNVNLWYNGTKHFTIYRHYSRKASYDVAYNLAVKLQTDFLDATDPHNKNWVRINPVNTALQTSH